MKAPDAERGPAGETVRVALARVSRTNVPKIIILYIINNVNSIFLNFTKITVKSPAKAYIVQIAFGVTLSMNKNAHKIFINTLMLTAASLVMRGVGLIFQVYLAGKIGPSAIGVYSLIMSVYTMFTTLGSGGIRFAVTRLTAEALAEGGCVRKTIRSSLGYSLFFGLFSGLCLFSGGGFISERWIGSAHCAAALRILALSLPFISLSAVFGGYFTGVERVMRSVSVNILEQLSRIFTTIALLSVLSGGIGQICTALAIAATAGEIISFFALSILYVIDIRRIPKVHKRDRYLPKLFGTAMPIAISSYMRTGLNSLGHILIPRGLQQSGANFNSAFAAYGTIHGMAFPMLLFPSALLTALAELIIPRLTSAQTEGSQRGINYMATRVIKIGLIFSVGVGGIMFFFGEPLGTAVYKNAEVGRYLRCFAPLVPVMYCDMITDGCLKGLGQHMKAMVINIAEATLNVILLYILIPRYAITGYGISIYVCECFNFVLSFGRLLRVADIDIGLFDLARILLSAAAAAKLVTFVFSGLGLVASILLAVAAYLIILYMVRVIAKSDVTWFKSVVRQK